MEKPSINKLNIAICLDFVSHKVLIYLRFIVKFTKNLIRFGWEDEKVRG